MKLSIVSTLYQSSVHLDEFYRRVCVVAESVAPGEFELILVNDGSPDDSLEIAVEISNRDSRVTIVDLSRNFGHHKAMMAGLAESCGDHVFLVDSDLEEEPELLEQFSSLMNIEKCDVVYGVQSNRRDKGLSKIFGLLFYKIFRFLTRVNQPDNILTARLMTRRYVDALLLHGESEINIGGLWVITGFEQRSLEVKKHQTSNTTYSFSSRLSHLVNAVTSFSSAPLVFVFYVGLFISFFSSLFVANLAIRYFFLSSPPDGYTSLIASVWLLAGLVILFLGVQGIYLAKIFSEVKSRPNVIVRHVYKKKGGVDHES